MGEDIRARQLGVETAVRPATRVISHLPGRDRPSLLERVKALRATPEGQGTGPAQGAKQALTRQQVVEEKLTAVEELVNAGSTEAGVQTTVKENLTTALVNIWVRGGSQANATSVANKLKPFIDNLNIENKEGMRAIVESARGLEAALRSGDTNTQKTAHQALQEAIQANQKPVVVAGAAVGAAPGGGVGAAPTNNGDPKGNKDPLETLRNEATAANYELRRDRAKATNVYSKKFDEQAETLALARQRLQGAQIENQEATIDFRRETLEIKRGSPTGFVSLAKRTLIGIAGGVGNAFRRGLERKVRNAMN